MSQALEQKEGRATGILRSWHNISTNSTKITLDGVTVEDLLSIIRDLMNKYGSEHWKQLTDDLYNHLCNYNNPHQFTIEQLDQNCIDVLYKQWIDEGYTGSKDEFIDVFFQYVDLADLPDMDLVLEGTSETHVPVVAVLAEYVRLHDVNLQAHKEQFERLMGTSEEFVDTKFTPTFAVSRLCNLGLKNFYNYQDTVNKLDLNDYPLEHRESVEGVFILQLHKGNQTGFSSGILNNDDKTHFWLCPINDTLDTTTLTSRYVRVAVTRAFIYIQYRDIGEITKNGIGERALQYNSIGDIINLAIRLEKDNTITLFYFDKKINLGKSNTRTQRLSSKIRIDNILKFPGQLNGFNDQYLTLGCAFFTGDFSDTQVKHLLTSYWPHE